MNKQILEVVEAVSNEKGVAREIIFEALEAALASATRRKHGDDIDVRVEIDRKTGEYKTFRRWKVFADDSTELEFPERELRYDDAIDVDPKAEIGGFVEVPMESVAFGRIAAQTAKQVIVQKVREAERAQVVDEYKDRVGSLVSGIVKRVDRHGVYVDLGGNAEGFVPREHMIPREMVRPQDRLKALLREVRSEARGPQLFLSRTSPDFLIELFKLEVPEVGQGLIQILGAARDPGARAKIAVKSLDPRIDPVGACVGMRGSRVQAVSNEIAGERVDIIPWVENPAQFVINAMQPAEVTSIVMDEDAHSMDIAVTEDRLSQAIGRGGQNVRLASELTGWRLNVMSEQQATERSEEEAGQAARDVQDPARRGRGHRERARAGGLLDDRGSRLRADQRAARHRGIRRGDGRGASEPLARRAADAGDRERGEDRRVGSRGGPAVGRRHGQGARLRAGVARHSHAR